MIASDQKRLVVDAYARYKIVAAKTFAQTVPGGEQTLRGLLDSLPGSERERLRPIPGAPPNMLRPPSGCAFRARCAYATEACAGDMPVLRPMGSLDTACVRAEELVQELAR